MFIELTTKRGAKAVLNVANITSFWELTFGGTRVYANTTDDDYIDVEEEIEEIETVLSVDRVKRPMEPEPSTGENALIQRMVGKIDSRYSILYPLSPTDRVLVKDFVKSFLSPVSTAVRI